MGIAYHYNNSFAENYINKNIEKFSRKMEKTQWEKDNMNFIT
jgi:hypothetical protein